MPVKLVAEQEIRVGEPSVVEGASLAPPFGEDIVAQDFHRQRRTVGQSMATRGMTKPESCSDD